MKDNVDAVLDLLDKALDIAVALGEEIERLIKQVEELRDEKVSHQN